MRSTDITHEPRHTCISTASRATAADQQESTQQKKKPPFVPPPPFFFFFFFFSFFLSSSSSSSSSFFSIQQVCRSTERGYHARTKTLVSAQPAGQQLLISKKEALFCSSSFFFFLLFHHHHHLLLFFFFISSYLAELGAALEKRQARRQLNRRHAPSSRTNKQQHHPQEFCQWSRRLVFLFLSFFTVVPRVFEHVVSVLLLLLFRFAFSFILSALSLIRLGGLARATRGSANGALAILQPVFFRAANPGNLIYAAKICIASSRTQQLR